MFDGIKEAIRELVNRSEDVPLSIVPDSKSMAVSFDTVSAGWYARNGYPGIYSALSGGLKAWSGEPVSTASALALSVVWACNRIISESVGFLPVYMMRESGGTKQPAISHPIYSALKYAPNTEMTTQNFTELLTSHCVLQGNSFAQIIRRSGTGVAMELRSIAPENVLPDREKDGQKRLVYVVKEDRQPDTTYTVDPGKPHDILHIRGLGWDGVRGYSVIAMARQSMGTAIAQERNVASFYRNGGRVPYLLEMPNRFESEQDYDRFRADWETTYAEPHKAPILENGLRYQQIGLSAADAQLLESRQFTIPEICRWFSVSPHLVGDLSRATFSNIESLADQFVRFTLMTWLTRWEQELWRCVLTPQEKSQGYYFRHDLNALLRSEFTARMAGYAQLLQNGVQSINEIRAREEMNPIPGGDEHHIQVNLMGIDQHGNPTTRVRVGSDQ